MAGGWHGGWGEKRMAQARGRSKGGMGRNAGVPLRFRRFLLYSAPR
jgi:hypothetical protein